MEPLSGRVHKSARKRESFETKFEYHLTNLCVASLFVVAIRLAYKELFNFLYEHCDAVAQLILFSHTEKAKSLKLTLYS